MKCKKQLKYNKLKISNIWEVYLDEDIWNRIRALSAVYNCSFSWITRYCVFRLARKKNIYMRLAMEKHSNKVRKQHSTRNKTHRHVLCLYGEDEKLLRLAAMQMGITVSHLIRMSLYWFLTKIEEGRVKWSDIFYHGTKICRYVDISRINVHRIPWFDHIFYAKWPVELWWKRAFPLVPMPCTPEGEISKLFRFLQPGELDTNVKRYLNWFLRL